jgi:hypothetical protein
MASRLREPTEQELRDLAMTLAGEIDQRRSPITDPQTRIEAANILATVVNRFSTDEPRRFGPSPIENYGSYSDVVRNARQYNAWMGQHVGTTQRNYDANRNFWDGAVKDFFAGDLQPSAPNATHYHADFVQPSWSRSIDRVAQAGPHVFYNDERFMGRPLGERRPSYIMAAPTLAQGREDQPNPQGDLNQQELANIAPPTPANAVQMAQARKPNVPNPTARPNWAQQAPAVEDRTIAGFVGQQMGVSPDQVVAGMIAPGASARARRGVSGLTPETQQRLTEVGSLLPPDNQPRITSTVRDDRFRTHAYGGAIDLRNRDLTPFQEAQQVAALSRAGFEAIGPYNATSGMPPHIHVGDDPRFNRAGSRFQEKARTDNPYLSGTQPGSGLYSAVDGGFGVSDAWFGPTAPTPTRNVQPRNMGDGSLDAVPGLTPRQDPRNITLPVAMPQPSRESMVQNYGQRALQASPASLPQLSANRATPQTAAFSSMQGGDYRAPIPSAAPQAASGGSSANTTARINQGFNAALAPRSMPSAIARVSPQGSYGTSSPQRSPDQFQYATRPTPAQQPSTRMETRTREVANPAYAAWESTQRASNQRSPTDFQYAPSGPSMSAMAANYGARALQGSDPFAGAPPAPPRTITERYQVSVPNPVARPNMAAPTPRGPQFAGVPNPMARPSSLPQRRSGLEQAFAGFNDWIGDRLPTMGGAAIGGALGGPLGALVGGLGGYGMQQVMGNQGGNGGNNGQPMNINPAPAPVQNIDNPAWSNPVFGVSQTVGQGNSAHDAFYDSQYGAGGFAW